MKLAIKYTAILCSLFFVQTAWSLSPQERNAISARRGINQDWRQKVITFSARSRPNTLIPVENREYAVDVALPVEQADLSTVTPLADYKTVQTLFETVRDARFIEDTEENMLRRITWLYPDDGCFARASMINGQLEANSQAPLSKLYVFGNLAVKSPNALPSFNGEVTWWYHVVASARVDQDVYILDPAVEPMRPLLLKEWLGRLGSDPFKAIVVCNPDTYTPYSDCYTPDKTEKSSDLYDEVYFLPLEKSRLEDLGRDWKTELGDTPPWLAQRKNSSKRPPRYL